MEHGLGCWAIAARVFKADGKSTFGATAIHHCMTKLAAQPGWRGERQEGSGAPRKTTFGQDRAIVSLLFGQRGKQKVTVSRLKRQCPHLRKLSDGSVENRLHEAHLKYLRRRRKSIVTKPYLQARIEYCHRVKRKHASTLLKWAYTDGTVYFLDRDGAEHEDSKRRSLGTHVWRRSDNQDALYQDCLGPSAYSKGQGIPVKVWGMLACGKLHIHVLDPGETMDKQLYSDLVEDKFGGWSGFCDELVCDHERCLRSDEALHALTKANLKLVEGFPKCSQDFNAMENAWCILKERLDDTMPAELEGRDDFVKRLHSAVKWANKHRADQLWYMSTNQKERAEDCLSQQPPGGRTKW